VGVVSQVSQAGGFQDMNKPQKTKSARRKFEATPRTAKILDIVTKAMNFEDAEIAADWFINECLRSHFATSPMRRRLA
jgi:hypothetical protein